MKSRIAQVGASLALASALLLAAPIAAQADTSVDDTHASGTMLPATGVDATSMLGFWAGGGALILVGATVALATTVRRNRTRDNT